MTNKLRLEKHDHLHAMTSPYVLVQGEGNNKQVVAVFDSQFAGNIRLTDVYSALAQDAPPPLRDEGKAQEPK